MTKKITFDTNIFSYYLRGDEGIKERLKRELIAGNEFIINPITYYEINRGLLAINNIASGGQGALFEKTAPWTPTKTFD